MKWIIKTHGREGVQYVARRPYMGGDRFELTDNPENAEILRDELMQSRARLNYLIEVLTQDRHITRVELVSEKADPTVGQPALELFKS